MLLFGAIVQSRETLFSDLSPAQPLGSSGNLLLPKTLGRYVLLEQIGAGGMGLVFKAMHASLKQVVALKTIRDANFTGDDDRAVSRFYREIEAAGAVIHPHVARATDAGEEQGVHFLITEYVDGIDLRKLTARAGPLPCGAACELLRQTALGLEAIRHQGLVHRDIKPSNILVDWNGQAKIVDLGLARVARGHAHHDDLTGSNNILGTIDYLAPEQALDSRDVDIRADLYSLGCTLVWLLTGRPLFGSPEYSSSAQKIRAHCDAEPNLEPLRELDERLLPLARRLLAKDPRDRFQAPLEAAAELAKLSDAAALATVLQSARSVEPPAATATAFAETRTYERGSTVPQPQPALGRRLIVRLALLAAALVCLAALASLVIPPWLGSDEASRGEVSRNDAAEKPTNVPTAPNLDELPAWRWHHLLEFRPKELIWRSSNSITRWHYDEALEQLTANCGELGLLEFGATTAPDYTLQLGLLQNRWKGGVGVFFGAHRDMHEGRPVIRYQYLQIQEARVREQRLFSLTRYRGLEPLPESLAAGFTGERIAVASTLLKGVAGEQVVELTVTKGMLRQVKVNGSECPELVDPQVNQQFSPADYQGGLGAWIDFSDATFRSARFMSLSNAPR